MDQERKINPSKVFAVETVTILPTIVDGRKVTFYFELGPHESIRDIFLQSPCQHHSGSFYGDGNHLANFPGEFNYALALYQMPGHKFDAYVKMTGLDLCSKCRCDMTAEKVFYAPLSVDQLFRVMIEEWSCRYHEFRVDFSLSQSFPNDSVKLYVNKIIKMGREAEIQQEDDVKSSFSGSDKIIARPPRSK